MKLILQAINALIRGLGNRISTSATTLTKKIDKAQTTATKAQATAATASVHADNALHGLQFKMGAENPTGTGSFSMNRKPETKVGDKSHAEGNNTTASSMCSHAEGNNTTASSMYSHAEGNGTTASGKISHAEGNGTTASGMYSHAEGCQTVASAYLSHAEGFNSLASSKNQHVQGKNNVEDSAEKYAHIVGNGESESKRSNAHTLDWDGNAWYAGYIEGKSLILPSTTEGSNKRFRITVDDSGTITAVKITE